MNSFLQAIQNMQALNTAPDKKVAERTSTKITRTPEGMSLRVYKDGSVYPSVALVEQFNLEYGNRVAESEEALAAEQGLDLFLAHDLPNFNKEIPNAILVAPVAKSEAKVDLFKTTEYNEDGTPKTSVLTQAPTTFGKNSLIPMLEIVLGKESSEIFAEAKYVDIQVETSITLPIAGDFVYLPKKTVRGENKGQLQLIRRGKLSIYPCVTLAEQTETLTEQGQDAAVAAAEEAATTPEYAG